HYVPASLNLLHINETTLNDPWGTPYQYVVLNEGKSFDLISAGKDKQFGTQDDCSLSHLDKLWQGAHGIHVSSDSHGGNVNSQVGGSKLDVKGGEGGGGVTVEAGGRTLHSPGGAEGGSVDLGTTQPASQPQN